MEENLPVPVMTKRIWSILRVLIFMLRKGLPKTNPILHLNMLFKRGKIAGSKAIANLIYHHTSSSSSSSSIAVAAAAAAIPRDYEFSCTNTPAYTFPAALQPPNIKIKLKNHFFFACTGQTVNDDENDVVSNNNCDSPAHDVTSPVLPGFGRLTPLVRPLRITDSPFPLRDVDDDNGYVDRAAEEFIQRFYNELKLQKRLTDHCSYATN